jgi:molybdate transport system permease protein
MNLYFNAQEINTVILSAKVALASTLLTFIPAVLFSLLLARKSFPGKTLLDGMLNLPLVLPPVTTGYLLLMFLGRRSCVGAFFEEHFGIRMSFTLLGAVIASTVVSFPLVLRSMRVAFEMVDPRLEQAAGTLGASPFQVMCRVTMPLALPGIINGLLLGFARSLGEFGATITFAGNIAGETRTIPLTVYTLMQIPGEESASMKLVAVSVILAFVAMIGSELLNRGMRKRLKRRNGRCSSN